MKKFLLTLMSLMTFLTAEEVVITLSSTEPISGIQFPLTGGGTYSTYVAQTNQFNQYIDIAPQFYNSVQVSPGGFVIMFSLTGNSIPSTN
ncbi:MAG: hypothetical protein CMG39_05325, partial [Candidatus Marinimicrobia bacterium]|nr:hypothetical protein [Candidatus Neomarinimicrobiota bacterium]